MIKTTIIIQIEDGENIYKIGDRVRVLMKPKNPDRPQLASEYIGKILKIGDDLLILDCKIDNAYIIVSNIDKIRFAKDGEDLDNTLRFDD